ncbi:MAG: uracil-DNA glycosylase [Phycisphaeraceae bacterium]|nr:uracil-DNA glycosylase [Phycisphaeraceae bacterium]
MDEAMRRAAEQLIRTDGLFGLEALPLAKGGLPAEPTRTEPAGPTSAAPPAPSAAPSQEGTSMSPDRKAEALAELAEEAAVWFKQNWPQDGWQNLVFGEGDPDADLMFVGEGPGADEDRLGRPFVGRAGKLLDKQIEAMGLRREQVYIANIAKCRPPGNRVPTPEEADRAIPFLERQIGIIGPKVIVSLGATSAKYLLKQPRLAITKERGQWREYCGIALMPTFHPAYLLRQYTPDNRMKVWEDLKKVLKRIGLPVPGRG